MRDISNPRRFRELLGREITPLERHYLKLAAIFLGCEQDEGKRLIWNGVEEPPAEPEAFRNRQRKRKAA